MQGERSVAEVLQDVLRNLQEIVRGEVRLAKAEIRHEATQASSSGLWLAAGAVGAVSAWMFFLWAVVYGLATVMEMWAATLVVAVGLALIAAGLLVVGRARFRQIRPVPERTIESLKENFEWIKQSTK